MLFPWIAPQVEGDAIEFGKRDVRVGIDAEFYAGLPLGPAISRALPGDAEIFAVDDRQVLSQLDHQASVQTAAQTRQVERIDAPAGDFERCRFQERALPFCVRGGADGTGDHYGADDGEPRARLNQTKNAGECADDGR